MQPRLTRWSGTLALAALAAMTAPATAADHYGLAPRSIELASAGPLAFGPDGVLFVGDPKAATLYAIDTKEYRPQSASAEGRSAYQIDDLQANIASAAATQPAQVKIVDMAVDPESAALFLSVTIGDVAKLVSLTPGNDAKLVNLDKISASSAKLQNPPEDKVTGEGRRASNKRLESITDLAYADGTVLVSGLAGQSPVSSVQEFQFPLRQPSSAAHLEIFHAAHGRTEDNAAIRAFIPINISGKPSLLAGFTCTPLVQFSLDSLQSGAKVRGTTVAELGNRNRPLDMIVYEQGEQTYLLVTNSARGVMKINTADVANQSEVTEPVTGGGTAGLPFEKIDSLSNVVQLAKLNNQLGVVLTQDDDKLRLSTIELP